MAEEKKISVDALVDAIGSLTAIELADLAKNLKINSVFSQLWPQPEP